MIYIYRDDQSYGPYEESTIIEWLNRGGCSPHDFACYEGMPEWQPLWTLSDQLAEYNTAAYLQPTYAQEHQYDYSVAGAQSDIQPYFEPLAHSQTPDIQRPGQSPVGSRLPIVLTQTFGLDVRAAVLIVTIDFIVFVKNTLSFGLLVPLGVAIGIVLAITVYMIQRSWYGDDRESAIIKALISGLLTAIPFPITPVIAVPGGIIGLINTFMRR